MLYVVCIFLRIRLLDSRTFIVFLPLGSYIQLWISLTIPSLEFLISWNSNAEWNYSTTTSPILSVFIYIYLYLCTQQKGNTPLMESIKHGKYEYFLKLLDYHPLIDFTIINHEGQTIYDLLVIGSIMDDIYYYNSQHFTPKTELLMDTIRRKVLEIRINNSQQKRKKLKSS